jgi:hypothetical protein
MIKREPTNKPELKTAEEVLSTYHPFGRSGSQDTWNKNSILMAMEEYKNHHVQAMQEERYWAIMEAIQVLEVRQPDLSFAEYTCLRRLKECVELKSTKPEGQ